MPGQLVPAARVMQSCECDGATIRPGATDDDKRRFCSFDDEMLLYRAVRHARSHDLLGLLQWCDRGEVRARGHCLEILSRAGRCETRKDMPVFKLHRRSILGMHEQEMEYLGTLLDVQCFGDLATRVLQ